MAGSIQNLHTNQRLLLYEMMKRGIEIEVLDEGKELVCARFHDHEELLLDRDSSIVPYHVSVLAGDKGFTKKRLASRGISVPLGEVFLAREIEYFLKAFRLFAGPVVVKPTFGSHGYDVYVNIATEEALMEALSKIIAHSGERQRVLIEEYFEASEYRVFLTVNGDYAVLKRDPAYIVGDGISTVKELVAKENGIREKRRNALCPLLFDEEAIRYLKEQGCLESTVPSRNQKVYLHRNSNVAMGGVCIDYTDLVHPSVIEIGKKVLASFPGLPYIGMDFMTNTVEKAQGVLDYRVIEVNTVPGIHMHHRPAYGKPRDVARFMVDLIFPETKEAEYGRQKSLTRF